jgi:hypothetical protein
VPAWIHAQIFVYNAGSENIGEYTTSGATIKSSLLSSPVDVTSMAISGSDLFLLQRTSLYNGSLFQVSEYSTSGAVINSSLITGLTNNETSIAVDGSNLFVAHWTGSVSEYAVTAIPGTRTSAPTSTATLSNADFLTDLSIPTQIAVSGSDLFVEEYYYISEYTTGGTLVNPGINTNGPTDNFAVNGSYLSVSQGDSFNVYTTSGDTVASYLGEENFNDINGIAMQGSNIFLIRQATNEVDVSDLAGNFTALPIAGLNSPSLIIVVPEPGVIGLISIAGFAILRRRPNRYA